MANLIVILVLVALVGGAGAYLYRAKKQGVQCIGCPSAKSCAGGCDCCASCKRPEKK